MKLKITPTRTSSGADLNVANSFITAFNNSENENMNFKSLVGNVVTDNLFALLQTAVVVESEISIL